MEKFRDSSLPLEERIDALLEALTVEEKLGFVGYRNAAVLSAYRRMCGGTRRCTG